MCMKLSLVPQPVGLLNLMLKFSINVQRRDLYLDDFVKCTYNIGVFSDALCQFASNLV